MRIHETSEKTTSAYYSSPEKSFYSGNHGKKIRPVSFTFDYRHKKGTDPKCTAPSMFPHYDIHEDEDDEDEELGIEGEQKHPYHIHHKNEPLNWVTIFQSGLKPFSVQRWPVVTTYILMALMFLIISGELLLSQQVTSKCAKQNKGSIPLTILIHVIRRVHGTGTIQSHAWALHSGTWRSLNIKL
jgi:hypothetical protein